MLAIVMDLLIPTLLLSAHLREIPPLPEISYHRDAEGVPLVGRTGVTGSAELQAHLAKVYCGSLGYEIAHVEDHLERAWLYDTIERLGGMQAAPALQCRLARILLVSEAFDHFMARRFGQVKRYGLEGGEALMAAIEVLLQATSAEHLVFGMAHRGRINLMVGCLDYPAAAVFHKLAGNSELPPEWPGSADVLSHLCTRATLADFGRTTSCTLTFSISTYAGDNPSGRW